MRHTSFLIYIFFCCQVLLLSSSCKKDDLTPAYLEIEYSDVNNRINIDRFNMDHDTDYDADKLEALSQHDFTHVNVYVNRNNLGCWELPCKVPVLDITDGDSSEVIILPCFRKTGMTNTIKGYPFLNILKQTVLLERGKTCDLSDTPPKYAYSPYVKIPYLETFSNSSSLTAKDTTSNLTFLPADFGGRKVGALTLNDSCGLSFDVSTPGIKGLPANGHYVFLEMTYNIENSLEVGMKISTAAYSNNVHQLGGIYATNGQWKTIYFDIADVIQGYNTAAVDATTATLVFTGLGDAGRDTHYYIDNIKILCEPAS